MAPRTHYGKDKEALLRRLQRMEGQVRGIQQMIADDRYCLDVVQQINALTAAAREVSLLVLEDHVRATVAAAVQRHDDEDAAVQELTDLLRRAMRA
jgi:DNA-binding FrmR family transcriptional regulator